jgi:hypothetical protein
MLEEYNVTGSPLFVHTLTEETQKNFGVENGQGKLTSKQQNELQSTQF